MEEAVLKSNMQRCQSDLKSGVMDPGRKNFDFSRKISEKFRFSMAISKNFYLSKNLDFSRQISNFFKQILKKFNFFKKLKKNRFPGNNCSQLILGKLFYFSS